MIIEISWTCQCGSKELSSWDAEPNETMDTLKDDVFHVYCDECEAEYPATLDNSKIELMEA